MDDRGFIVRRPRHEACPETDLRLTITEPISGIVCEAGLADLSRQGLKAVANCGIVEGATVYVLAEIPGTTLHVSSPGTIRWSKLQDDGQWNIGIVFHLELPWETMGELFLHGVLSPVAVRGAMAPKTV